MQGASETVKSICSIVGQPIMSSLFAYWIHDSRKVITPHLEVDVELDVDVEFDVDVDLHLHFRHLSPSELVLLHSPAHD